MRSKEELINEIEARNEVRREADLPLLSVAKEIDRISTAELRQDYLDWYNTTPLRAKVAASILQECRDERHDPNWIPHSYLNGGGDYSARVDKKMHQLWKEERKK